MSTNKTPESSEHIKSKAELEHIKDHSELTSSLHKYIEKYGNIIDGISVYNIKGFWALSIIHSGEGMRKLYSADSPNV
jgi:hypothetical protein